LSFETEHFVSQ